MQSIVSLKNQLIRNYWQYRRELRTPNYATYKQTLVRVFTFLGLITILFDFFVRYAAIALTSGPLLGEPIMFHLILAIICIGLIVTPRFTQKGVLATLVFFCLPILYAIRTGIEGQTDYSAAIILSLCILLSGFLISPKATFAYGIISFVVIVFIVRDGYNLGQYEGLAAVIACTVLISYILSRTIDFVFLENQTNASKMIELYQNDKQLFSNLAHRLKTPLTILQTEIKMQLQHNQQVKEAQLNKLINEINNTIQELTKISKVNLSQFVDLKTSINIFELVTSAKNDAEILAKNYADLHNKKRIIRLDFPEYLKPAKIFGAKDQLREALLNIIDNCISHNPNNANLRISISVYEFNGDYAISIADNGQGMSGEQIKEILSNRMEADPLNRHSHIGLAIVRNIIKNHRGRMNILSQPGKGTSVEIILPPR